MRTRFILLLMFSSILSAYSQDTIQGSLGYRARTGSYEIGFYDSNIVKIKFSPFGYKTSEQLSDAVILGRSGATGIKHYFLHDSVVLDCEGIHLAVFPWRRNEYRGFGLPLQAGEKIFGGGERAIPLNRRGYRLELYNQPVYGYAEGAENLY